jgi:TPR repeat protein
LDVAVHLGASVARKNHCQTRLFAGIFDGVAGLITIHCNFKKRVAMIRLIRAAAFLLCTAVATPAISQDFDKGFTAYQAGDYETALLEFRLLAAQGNARAQNTLGVMYDLGLGVIQDAVLAHSWYNISGANGVARGSENRSEIENRMTREQIAEAQALARRCVASDYQDCG